MLTITRPMCTKKEKLPLHHRCALRKRNYGITVKKSVIIKLEWLLETKSWSQSSCMSTRGSMVPEIAELAKQREVYEAYNRGLTETFHLINNIYLRFMLNFMLKLTVIIKFSFNLMVMIHL